MLKRRVGRNSFIALKIRFFADADSWLTSGRSRGVCIYKNLKRKFDGRIQKLRRTLRPSNRLSVSHPAELRLQRCLCPVQPLVGKASCFFSKKYWRAWSHTFALQLSHSNVNGGRPTVWALTDKIYRLWGKEYWHNIIIQNHPNYAACILHRFDTFNIFRAHKL